MKHEQFLKLPSIFIEKCLWRKGRPLITPTFFNRFRFWQRILVVQYVLLLNGEVPTDPEMNQESTVFKTWAILQTSINFYRQMAVKRGLLLNNSYMFKPIYIVSTLLSSAVCPLVKSKSYDRSNKASRVNSR